MSKELSLSLGEVISMQRHLDFGEVDWIVIINVIGQEYYGESIKEFKVHITSKD
jgi:hypothetical protein